MYEHSSKKAKQATSQQNFKRAKLLLVDDNPDHVQIMQLALEQSLPEVKLVWKTTEQETLAYLKECQERDMPKLVLLDLYLPQREDGLAVLVAIRTQIAPLGKIPVVLLSFSEDQADVYDAYQGGCSSYTVKPATFTDWLTYFQTLRHYWWETVTLPKVEISLF
jgi:CheY-like chemotaxis protein